MLQRSGSIERARSICSSAACRCSSAEETRRLDLLLGDFRAAGGLRGRLALTLAKARCASASSNSASAAWRCRSPSRLARAPRRGRCCVRSAARRPPPRAQHQQQEDGQHDDDDDHGVHVRGPTRIVCAEPRV
jgi:hypothetical protein